VALSEDRAGGEAPFYAVVRILRQRWWVIALCALLAPTVAYLVTSQKPDVFKSTAKVLLTSGDFEAGLVKEGDTGGAPASADGADSTSLDLASVTAVAQGAADLLGGKPSADDIAGRVEIVPNSDSSVIGVEASGPTARGVAPLANAYATAYITFRRDEAREKIAAASSVLQKQLDRALNQNSDNRAIPVKDLRGQIAQLNTLSGLQDGNAKIVERAVTPHARVSPKPRRSAIIALGFGIVLGIGLALLFEFLSRRLNDPAEIEDLYSEPLLGTIPESRSVAEAGFGLTMLNAAEHAAFQRVRGNLRYYNDYNIGSVLIISALPGEGKSTVARHLAAAAAEAGTSVILLEADLRLPTLVKRLGLPPTAGLIGILRDGVDPADIIQRVPLGKNSNGGGPSPTMDVISAGPAQANPTYLIESDAMERLILDLEERYDLVIIDTPAATLVPDGLALVDKVSGVIVVSRVRKNTRAAARSLRGQLSNVRANVLGVVVNGVGRADGMPNYGYGYGPTTNADELTPSAQG
jgi:capsular exopolysaccharide synthesis family protein